MLRKPYAMRAAYGLFYRGPNSKQMVLIMPTRIIRIDKLPHQEMAARNHYGVDFVLNDPLPKGLFDRQIPFLTNSKASLTL